MAAEALQAKINQYKRMDIESNKLDVPRQQFSQQLNECMMVRQELEIAGGSANVYKLVGPVLLLVDLSEAKENVEKRIEFIKGELFRIESQIDKRHADMTELGNTISAEQRDLQRQAAESANQIVAREQGNQSNA